MYDILWNLHYFCGLNHTKSILTDLFPNYTEEKQSIRMCRVVTGIVAAQIVRDR